MKNIIAAEKVINEPTKHDIFVRDLKFFIRWLIFNIIVEYWSCVTWPFNRRSILDGEFTSNKPNWSDITKKIFKFTKRLVIILTYCQI